ncbi:type II toxin-antitoxin system VapC family toxin [bacterium]|nr:type II toxin-antitoxin system VapC family toxin [bacterium]MBU1635321.1 type II toxin-antitoxin system VapC family toxin [bacterium]MBU1872107.1 type II toxin-antitoxin system VapC family toxin [bacterium]
MIAVDTNILVRFFVRDDERQYQQAAKLLCSSEDSGESIYVSTIVLVELVWVLKGGYKVLKSDICKTLSVLLTNQLFVFANAKMVRDTLNKYQSGNCDFADYLIALEGIKEQARTTFTFDKRCGGDSLFSLLS